MRPSTERPEESPSYLVERIRSVLANDRRVGEMELDIDVDEARVRVTGTVLTRHQREAIPVVLGEEFPELDVENVTEVVSREEPEEAERLT